MFVQGVRDERVKFVRLVRCDHTKKLKKNYQRKI